jgi:uncharacterized protein YhfF
MDGKYEIKISQDGVVTKNKIVLCSEILQMYTRDQEVLQMNGNNEVITDIHEQGVTTKTVCNQYIMHTQIIAVIHGMIGFLCIF